MRMNYAKVAPLGVKPLLDIEKYLSQCGLEHGLLHLIKMRASQSTAALTASICTRRTRGRWEKPSSVCMD